jgi:hypothetical protein
LVINQSIKKGLAALMLLLFAFSVTPKLILHDLVANHKDTALKSSTDNNAQFNIAGFNCGCDNLVVESPFVENSITAEIITQQVFSEYINTEAEDFISVNQFYFELRGPPSLA